MSASQATLKEIIEKRYGSLHKFKLHLGLGADLYSIFKRKRAPSGNWVRDVSAALGVDVGECIDGSGMITDKQITCPTWDAPVDAASAIQSENKKYKESINELRKLAMDRGDAQMLDLINVLGKWVRESCK